MKKLTYTCDFYAPILNLEEDTTLMIGPDGWRYQVTSNGTPYLYQQSPYDPILIMLVGEANRRIARMVQALGIGEFEQEISDKLRFSSLTINLLNKGKSFGHIYSGNRVELRVGANLPDKLSPSPGDFRQGPHHVIIRPVQDPIYACTQELVAFQNQSGIVYCLHGPDYIVLDAMSFRVAFQWLNAPLRKASMEALVDAVTRTPFLRFSYKDRFILCSLKSLQHIPAIAEGGLLATPASLIDCRYNNHQNLLLIN